MTIKQIIGSLALFVVAGSCEIGGGWLVWQHLRAGRPWGWALTGSLVLVVYGVVAAHQPADFGRVYAAYGGVFIAMSLAWGWGVDGQVPDRWDVVGAALAVVGATIMMFAPRR